MSREAALVVVLKLSPNVERLRFIAGCRKQKRIVIIGGKMKLKGIMIEKKIPVEWQEVVHIAEDGEKHIADLKTDQGLVVEFQHSFIKDEEVNSRGDFYKNMI